MSLVSSSSPSHRRSHKCDSTSWLRIGPLVGGDREAVCLVSMSALVLSLSHRAETRGGGEMPQQLPLP